MLHKILIVDDSMAIRLQAKRALTVAGFDVIEAVDGVDAIAKLDGAPDVRLIVCDVNMPRMNGVDFAEMLQHRPEPRPTVIMLTTEGNPELMARARAAGVKGWLLKPLQQQMLVATATKLTGA